MEGEIPEIRRQPLLLSMQKWKLKVDDFNSLAPSDRHINDAQTLVHLKRFIKNVPELKDINNMVTVMCTGLLSNGHTPSPLDKIQMYFNVATTVDKGVKAANRGRRGRGTPSRNIHLAEILGEDIKENDDEVLPLENNAHEVLPDGNDVEDEVLWIWKCYKLLPLYSRE